MLPELTTYEFSAALDAVAGDALSVLERAAPPVDALALARAMGIQVAWDTSQAGRGRVVRLRPDDRDSQGSILLRPDPRQERMQWTIAHEIGELLAAQVFSQLHVDPREAPGATRETVANQLAGRLLLPSQSFARHGKQHDWDLVAMKKIYATASHELIARRMLDFTTNLAITIFDHGKQTFRRGNMPGRMPPWDALERETWREAYTRSQTAALGDHRLRVRAWPIHEPQWKREIVRSDWHALEGCDEWPDAEMQDAQDGPG